MFYYLYKDVAGFWRWSLFAANMKKIADSGEGYVNKVDAEHGINLVKVSSGAAIRLT